MSAVQETTPISSEQTDANALRRLLEKQRAAFRRRPPDYATRMAALEDLAAALLGRQREIVGATNEDFGGRARQETLALELAPLLDSIRHARKHLASWMSPRKVPAGIHFFPARARIVYQPLGVVGILGAWNYPTFLTFSPLVDAIAAGNHVIVKPSELAPRTAEVVRKLIADSFPEEYLTVVPGDARTAATFASLAFDHLLFTGSTRVGRMVMKAASENLTPVTLELGGKSPAIVHPDFPLLTAVRRILTGKLYNAGQTCLAPDYVLVHEPRREEFLKLASEVTQTLYPTWNGNPDYTRIINSQHFDRLQHYVEDAVGRGARAVPLGGTGETSDHKTRLFLPVALVDTDDSMLVMREEIFGPILPVLTYRDLQEALAYVGRHAPPLALYYFDHSQRRIDHVLRTTASGGVTVNDVIYHIAQNNLPFGGVGPSGMGHYHGKAGFETFSKKRGVFLQSRFSSLALLRPPYGPLSERVIRFLLRK
jgi:coniferyl-aldehyde dehydrogenase